MYAAGRVLLLDIDVPFRQILADALNRIGVEVSWRARILGLFDTIAEVDPIALVVSADLPGSDPLELIRSVRRSRWATLPILVVIDRPDRSFELRAYVDGADAVLEREGCISALAAHILGYVTRRKRHRREAARDLADSALALTASGRPLATGRATAPGGAEVPGARKVPGGARMSAGSAAPGGATVPGDETARGGATVAGEVTAPDIPPMVPSRHGTSLSVGFCPSCAAPMKEATDGTRVLGPLETAVPDVILVDDDPSLLEMLRYALANRGYRTLSLSNGLDALRALKDLDTGGRRPVVLLDVDLPGLDGFRILHELGGCRPDDYQVILCTVHSSEATQVLGLQSGAIDYIVKPFRMPVVLAKVERLLGPATIDPASVHVGA